MKNVHLLGVLLVTGLATVPAHATLLGLNTIGPGGSTAPGNANANPINTITGYTTTCPSFAVPGVSAPPSTLKIAAGGTVVADTCNQTTIANNGLSVGALSVGTVTMREVVVREAGTNTLDFYYQAAFTPNALGTTGSWGVTRIFGVPFTANPPDQVGNYSNASLFSTGGGASTLVVDNLNRISGAGFAGGGPCTTSTGASTGKDCITFDFSPTQLTDVVVISTSDQVLSGLTKTDMGLDMGAPGGASSGTDYFYGYAPLTGSVPEPVSIVLLGSVLAFSAFFVRRRKSAKNESSVS